jgi:hypothetical protein
LLRKGLRPWLDRRHGPILHSIGSINGIPLPDDLIVLIKAGRWSSPKNQSAVDRLFPPETGTKSEVVLYAADYMPFENKHWLNQKDPRFLGSPDYDNPPGDIDPKRSVLIGDLGPGSDQPIALDYRASEDEPRVLTLIWSRWGDKNRWVEIAPNVRTFAELVGL